MQVDKLCKLTNVDVEILSFRIKMRNRSLVHVSNNSGVTRVSVHARVIAGCVSHRLNHGERNLEHWLVTAASLGFRVRITLFTQAWSQ